VSRKPEQFQGDEIVFSFEVPHFSAWIGDLKDFLDFLGSDFVESRHSFGNQD
jgi:hypothetical protein